ncbi:MAG: nucleotidyltransferase family protein [Pseudomonadota bacterium]|nr:nucleotidyltransferase family protein [Pseudomonadota bacterium]
MLEQRLAVAVLAAGASRRFGDEDKLTAIHRGRMLGEYAVDAIPAHLFQERWVIAPNAQHPCAKFWEESGFQIALNARAGEGMSTSVALAALLSMQRKCSGLLIALADMPLVPESHFTQLVKAAQDDDSIVASARSGTPMPPALFGCDHFRALSQLSGDRGAGAMLADAKIVPCPPVWLTDVDTKAGLRDLG